MVWATIEPFSTAKESAPSHSRSALRSPAHPEQGEPPAHDEMAARVVPIQEMAA